MNRRELILSGCDAASDARGAIGADEFSPIDPYELAECLGASVKFLAENMEGFYFKGPPPRIYISSLRPLARRAFTCAHEIGHHWFGHGDTLDELERDDRAAHEKPAEILAEAFASFLMMPTVGVRGAFHKRGVLPPDATPLQMMTVAAEFGVGYTSLITHLAMTTYDISPSRRTELLKWPPSRIRRAALGRGEASACAFLDVHSSAQSYDLEVGDLVVLPPGSSIDDTKTLSVESCSNEVLVVRAVRRGTATCAIGPYRPRIRVSPSGFAGRAVFRHLEDPDAD